LRLRSGALVVGDAIDGAWAGLSEGIWTGALPIMLGKDCRDRKTAHFPVSLRGKRLSSEFHSSVMNYHWSQ
jgi:hypothetical protein